MVLFLAVVVFVVAAVVAVIVLIGDVEVIQAGGNRLEAERVTYLVLEALDFYGFMFCERRYSADFLWFMAMKVCGCLVTASALRNFGHLAKSDVNKGMFAESRTFS